MGSHWRLAILAAAVFLAAGCGNARPPAEPAHAAAVTPSPAASASLSGLELQSGLAMCAAQIEVGTADGHDYSSDQPHSPDLPSPCRPLNLSQLITAIQRAVNDMQRDGG